MSDSICGKLNGNILKKYKHLLQILVRRMNNDLILPVSLGVFYGDRNEDGRVCIGYTSLRKYIPEHT